MYCPKCQSQNEENAHFCKNCGTNLYAPQAESEDDNISSILIFVFIIVDAVSILVRFVNEKLKIFDSDQYGPFYMEVALWFIGTLAFILIPFSIKNKTLKIIGLVIVALIVIYSVYQEYRYIVFLLLQWNS